MTEKGITTRLFTTITSNPGVAIFKPARCCESPPSGQPQPLRSRPDFALYLIASTLILRTLAVHGAARAEEFSPNVKDFHGIGESLSIFEREGLHVELINELDFGTLGPEDAVLLLHIGEVKNARGIIPFIESGGALILADESSALDSVYSRFGFERAPAGARMRNALDGFEGVYIAPRDGRHPLAEGVDFLVTDLPRPFYHPNLSPIFRFDETHMIVAVGRLGAGELIALGDSSLFINQLARLSKNRRFLHNLAAHLADRYARLLIVRGPGSLISREAPANRGLGGFREAIGSIRSLKIDSLALYLISLILLLALTLTLGSRLARGAVFEGPERLGYEGEPPNTEWKIRQYQQRGANLNEPISGLRDAVYRAMSRRLLRGSGRFIRDARAALEAASEAGVAFEELGVDPRFFERLDAFALSSEIDGAQRASRRDFIRLLEEAETLLARLETIEVRRER